jgi:cytochrome c-type protein NapC
MEDNVYKEYVPTIHHSNRSGVRATCSDCHVPKPWIHKMVRKVKASNELLHKALGTINTPEKFDAKRLTLAKNVWKTMKATDSRECRNCHNFESMNPKFQQPRARKQHLNAFETGQTCIDCHKGIAHKNVRDQLTDEELDELEAPNPAFARAVPQTYLDGLKEIEEIEAAETEEAKLAKTKDGERVQARIDQAVEGALKQAAAAAAATAASAAAASDSGAASDDGEAASDSEAADSGTTETAAGATFDVDWSGVPSREISLLYPGQSSMEWVLIGKSHGGARPFTKAGDSCVACHDKEIEMMGAKIVTGEKLEPTPIPDKRGHIPVTVQAAHDADNLYLRFEWLDSVHTPAPFVDGGKMDPDNQMKLAVMFATDDVMYASQAGCWGTCHDDLKSMPGEMDPEASKYITESRTEVEIKGRRGKKLGGWDKRKTDEELTAEMDQAHYMDILRFNAGSGEVEDGHVLADRVMEGGQGVSFNGRKEGDIWVVEMSRKLSSDKPGDVSLALDGTYNFGFAIHDDYTSARFHHVSLGYRLGFDDENAEVNAVEK